MTCDVESNFELLAISHIYLFVIILTYKININKMTKINKFGNGILK